ncbi:hypothetical protein Tco_1438853 [Tanacetum coccineum]
MDTDCRLFLVGAPFTQGTIPSIPIGGSISPEGFLPSILLLVVIIVTVVVVIVILIVVVDDDVSLYPHALLLSYDSTRLGHHRLGSSTNVTFFISTVATRKNYRFSRSNQRNEENAPSVHSWLPSGDNTSVMSCWMAAKVMAGVSDVDVLLGGILST